MLIRTAVSAVMILCFAGGLAHAEDPAAPFTTSIGIRMLPVTHGKIEDLETSKEGEFKAISIAEDFHLGLGEVTIAQWKALMDVNPDFPDGSNRVEGTPLEPVGGVRFDEAIEFCRRLTARERETGTLPEGSIYRLPTEEQWEFACRAGSKGAFPAPVKEIANHYWPGKDSGGKMTDKELKPNPWGFRHMNGNLLEWCLPAADAGEQKAGERPVRGGGYRFVEDGCRSGARKFFPADYFHPIVGFRVALVRERH